MSIDNPSTYFIAPEPGSVSVHVGPNLKYENAVLLKFKSLGVGDSVVLGLTPSDADLICSLLAHRED